MTGHASSDEAPQTDGELLLGSMQGLDAFFETLLPFCEDELKDGMIRLKPGSRIYFKFKKELEAFISMPGQDLSYFTTEFFAEAINLQLPDDTVSHITDVGFILGATGMEETNVYIYPNASDIEIIEPDLRELEPESQLPGPEAERRAVLDAKDMIFGMKTVTACLERIRPYCKLFNDGEEFQLGDEHEMVVKFSEPVLLEVMDESSVVVEKRSVTTMVADSTNIHWSGDLMVDPPVESLLAMILHTRADSAGNIGSVLAIPEQIAQIYIQEIVSVATT